MVLPVVAGLLFLNGSKVENHKNNAFDDGVNWMTWEEVQKMQQKSPRKVFVDVYTHWCGWCKKMDASTFKNKYVVKYLNDNYYSIKFNAETKEPIVFKGQKFEYVASGRRGYNELAAELLNGRLSYPTTLFMDENLNLLTVVPGYQNAKDLDAILNFFGGDNYKSVDWAGFQQSYKSPISN